MTIKHCSVLVSSFLLLMLISGTLCAEDARPEPRQLLQSAHQASDLTALLPYTMQGTIVINPGTENEKKGSITIYRDRERSRSELRVEDYQEIKVAHGNKLYISRSTPVPVPMLGKLADTDHYWDKLIEDGDAKVGEVSKKKVQGQSANCFDVKDEPRHRLCFHPERQVLLESMDRQRAVEFTNYGEVEGRFFPAKITVLLELEKQEKPVLVIENIKIQKTQFAETAFAPPQYAMEFDTCDGMQPARPLQTPMPDFSQTVMRKYAGAPPVNVYGIINKDGSLESVKVLTSDAEVRQTILDTVKQWRYTPAMCGSSPVATEKEIPFMFRMGR